MPRRPAHRRRRPSGPRPGTPCPRGLSLARATATASLVLGAASRRCRAHARIARAATKGGQCSRGWQTTSGRLPQTGQPYGRRTRRAAVPAAPRVVTPAWQHRCEAGARNRGKVRARTRRSSLSDGGRQCGTDCRTVWVSDSGETVRNGMLIGQIQLKAATWFRSIGHTRHYRRWCGESGDLFARLFAGGPRLGRPVLPHLLTRRPSRRPPRLDVPRPPRRMRTLLPWDHARALSSRLCFVGRVSALCARSRAARSRPLPPARLRGGVRAAGKTAARGGATTRAAVVHKCRARRGVWDALSWTRLSTSRRHASWKGRRDERVRGGAAIVYGRWAGGAAVAGGSPASLG